MDSEPNIDSQGIFNLEEDKYVHVIKFLKIIGKSLNFLNDFKKGNATKGETAKNLAEYIYLLSLFENEEFQDEFLQLAQEEEFTLILNNLTQIYAGILALENEGGLLPNTPITNNILNRLSITKRDEEKAKFLFAAVLEEAEISDPSAYFNLRKMSSQDIILSFAGILDGNVNETRKAINAFNEAAFPERRPEGAISEESALNAKNKVIEVERLAVLVERDVDIRKFITEIQERELTSDSVIDNLGFIHNVYRGISSYDYYKNEAKLRISLEVLKKVIKRFIEQQDFLEL